MNAPMRHWRSYGTEPLPSGAEALDEPFRAFPSWFMRVTRDRCGKDRMLSETHTVQRDLPIRAIIAKMRHDGCGGRPGRVELVTGISASWRSDWSPSSFYGNLENPWRSGRTFRLRKY